MMQYSEEEIIGMCEAYEFYSILPDEEQNKIPKDFVQKMEKCSKYNLGTTINCIEDIKANRLSKEGVKNMAYMCLYLK